MEGDGGDGGVAAAGGCLRPADTALFEIGADVEVVTVVLVFGEGKRRGVGDLYLELTSR